MSFRIFALLSLVFINLVSSCTEAESTKNTSSVDLYEFQGFNMASYDIPIMIMLPDETASIGAATDPEVIHTEGDFKWEIMVGPNFTLVINDWGNRLTKVNDEKERLKSLSFYQIDYIKDEPTMIVYKKTLQAKTEKGKGSKVGTQHVSYHVYAQKQIAGINYVFESRAEGHDKQIIDLMTKAIASITDTSNKES